MSILITDAGLAEVINAEHSGTTPVVLSHIAFGTGQYTASASQTALQSEFKRFETIKGGAIGDNVIHLTVNDNSTETYTVNEVGVFTASGTLFAVYSQTTPIIQKAGNSEILLAIDVILTNINPDSVTVGDTTFVLNPATTTKQGIVELATAEETITGSDGSRAVTPAGLSARTATTGRKGLVELATFAEAIAGTDGDRAVTPAALTAAFVKEHSDAGFQKLPNGFIIQWGKALVANGDNGTSVTFPTTFPNGCKSIVPVSMDSVAVSYMVGTVSEGSAVLKHNGNGGVNTYWIAVGY
jgi:hypothetical protein